MGDVTEILSQIEEGDPDAAEQLLPLVYQELRRLAAAKVANERPGQTLQATALVHEAYLWSMSIIDNNGILAVISLQPLLKRFGASSSKTHDESRASNGAAV